MDYIIREMTKEEYPLLKDFLYEAIFQQDENNLLSRDIINQPTLRIYYEDFGRKDDYCLVAEADGNPVGAVWSRILIGNKKGYGYVEDELPELSISLYKAYRNQGIGTELMKSMLNLLREAGYKGTSLSVQKDNYASGMYVGLGYHIVKELHDEYLMVYRF